MAILQSMVAVLIPGMARSASKGRRVFVVQTWHTGREPGANRLLTLIAKWALHGHTVCKLKGGVQQMTGNIPFGKTDVGKH